MTTFENNFKLGLIFSLTAVIFWGMLPIALKLSAGFIDPVTLTWFRFFIAFIISFTLQRLMGNLSGFKKINVKDWLMLSLAAIFSMANYISFVYCLDYLEPGPAQLNFQTAPFFLAFGGVLIFKEKLNALQMSCFATLALGMLLFFHPFLSFSNSNSSQIWIGILIVQFSALSWTCYALIQKSMISKLSPANILLFIYGAGLLLMLPFNKVNHFLLMDFNQWIIAIFCAINTLIAYGSFAQAMKYWPTTQVGAMVTLTPVISFSFTSLVVGLGWWPEIFSANEISTLGFLGIALVILSVLTLQFIPLIKRRFLNG